MNPLDILIIVIYCLGLLGVGFLFSSKSAQSASQMFVAGRQSPWWISGLSAYMTMFSAGTFVVWGGIAYEFGFVAITISMAYAVAAFLVGFFIAGKWRLVGVSTAAEYIHLRFGKNAFQFYTWFKILFSFTTGLALYGLAKVICPLIPVPVNWFIAEPSFIDAATGMGQLSAPWACAILGLIVVIYTMAGGLWAVLLTDTLQFFVLALTVVIAVFLSLDHLGGFSTFIEKTPENFLDVTAGDFTLLFLFGWTLVNAFSLGAEWQFLQRYFCVSTPKDASKTLYLFGVLYLIFPFFFMAPAMFYRAVTDHADPEEAFILMCREVLPSGMIGMMIAALFSATASSVSSVLNVYASVLTDDIYKKSLRPEASEKETVVAGRVITLLIGLYMIAGGIIIPALTSMRDWIIIFTSLIAPALLLPTIWGLLSSKINAKAVWWCVIVNCIAGLFAKFGFRSDGWFSNIEFFAPLIHLNEHNLRVSDLMIGIWTPFLTLVAMQLLSRVESDGWNRLQSFAKKQQSLETNAAVDSRRPAKVIVLCLGFLSIIMLLITVLSIEEQKILAVATALLIAITVAFTPFLKRTAS